MKTSLILSLLVALSLVPACDSTSCHDGADPCAECEHAYVSCKDDCSDDACEQACDDEVTSCRDAECLADTTHMCG